MSEPTGRRAGGARPEPREVGELRAIAERQPELAAAVNLHIELLEVQRRIHARVPLPWIQVTAEHVARHERDGRPLLRFDDIPMEPSDLRLAVRQTADILHRFGALEDPDYGHVQTLGRGSALTEVARRWFETGRTPAADGTAAAAGDMVAEVLTLAMRPFLSRCAEAVQQHPDLAQWTHPTCPLCGDLPDLAVITPAAERHLVCGRCGLQWRWESLSCPYCRNSDRSRITSFATPDGQYRVYGCDECKRYLKAFDGRGRNRPVLPTADAVATLPLDAAAISRGYSAG